MMDAKIKKIIRAEIKSCMDEFDWDFEDVASFDAEETDIDFWCGIKTPEDLTEEQFRSLSDADIKRMDDIAWAEKQCRVDEANAYAAGVIEALKKEYEDAIVAVRAAISGSMEKEGSYEI